MTCINPLHQFLRKKNFLECLRASNFHFNESWWVVMSLNAWRTMSCVLVGVCSSALGAEYEVLQFLLVGSTSPTLALALALHSAVWSWGLGSWWVPDGFLMVRMCHGATSRTSHYASVTSQLRLEAETNSVWHSHANQQISIGHTTYRSSINTRFKYR